MSDMYTEINLRADLRAANDTIDMLRAKLCANGHLFVLTKDEVINGCVKEHYTCTNCGFKHIKIREQEEQ